MRVLVVTVLATLLAAPASAQIQPGRIYAGGEQISEPGLGLRLTIPAGWRGALSPDGEAFLVEPEGGGSLIMVIADELTEAEARSEMTQPQDLGDGITLTPAGPVRNVATGHLAAPYTVTGTPSEMVGSVDIRLTSAGLGVAFVLLAPPAEAEAHAQTLREFAFSLGIEEPKVQASGGNDAWEPYLRGMYLARFYTGSGYTESTELWLCSDGSFAFDDQAGGYGGGASGAYQGRGGGRWTATGAGATGQLLLQWADGTRSTWDLSYEYGEERLYVNGHRWLRGNNERCR